MFKFLVLIMSIVLLQACTDSSVKPQSPADVTSMPSAATVYANNTKLGKTPLQHKLYEAFPAGWENSSYQAQGMLMVKKQGCEDFTLKINDYILSKPIHAKLKCDPNYMQEKLVTTMHSSLNETKKRLENVEVLFKQGLITEDEYAATRQRILNEL